MSAEADGQVVGAAETQSGSTVTQSGSGAGGAQSGTGAESRGSQTGVGQADVAAGYRSAGAETTSDIGQAEAYGINMKKLVADELDHAANLRSIAAEAIGRRSRNAEDYDHALRQTAIQAVQNAVTLSNRVNNSSADMDLRVKSLSIDHDSRVRALQEGELARTVRHSDLAIDRQWNIDEVAASIAKNPVFQDAVAAAVVAALAVSTSGTKKV